MKTEKALKRLTKVEVLLSDVMARYSAASPQVKDALQQAKDAAARARQSVEVHEPAGSANGGAKKHSALTAKKPKKTKNGSSAPEKHKRA